MSEFFYNYENWVMIWVTAMSFIIVVLIVTHYVKQRVDHFNAKKNISDKDMLLEAKATLIKLTQSKRQTAEFIESVNKTIKIIDILENKIK